MGGSGGSFRYQNINKEEIFRKIKNSETETEKQEYELWVNTLLDSLLGQFNNRDTEAIQKHIETILIALNDEIEGEVVTRFGGSISRHTHINGLSDVDALVILNNSELADYSPDEVLDYFYKRLKHRFKQTDIEKGDTAVTLHFSDGDVQLIPALRFKTGIKIPNDNEWSTNIKPAAFAKALTDLNGKLYGKLIPSIKLIKGVVSGFPEKLQLNGYHIEALALEIFKNEYLDATSPHKIKDLVTTFFKEAPSFVRKPSKDITGQSQHLDEYLGKKESISRLMVADTLDRTFRQIELSDTGNIKNTWEDLFSHLD